MSVADNLIMGAGLPRGRKKFDELSLGLAPVIVQEIYRMLEKARRQTTMLVVEQSVEMELQNTS